jgi:carboxypeptidase C (cathepsin A)
MYSGLIAIDKDEEPTQEMFYTLFSNEMSNDLFFMFSGGPGGTSMGTVFTETGPLKLSEPTPGTFQVDYINTGLDQVANLILIDNPLGVGFSTTQTPVENQETLVLHFKMFLSKFLDLHPAFAASQIYIGGVSYGGKFAPNVAWGLKTDDKYKD